MEVKSEKISIKTKRMSKLLTIIQMTKTDNFIAQFVHLKDGLEIKVTKSYMFILIYYNSLIIIQNLHIAISCYDFQTN